VAGHNKWSKIKHRKAVVDKRRGKVWTKISKAIIVAAKHGGGDPDSNLSLRYAIDEARYANMPRDTIERAIKKGAGGGDTANYETIRYEGYAPGGVAVIVDALTDNRTRTITDVRNAFNEAGGNVGASGCVAYMFQPRGQILVGGKGLSEDRVMELAIEAGALDAQPPEEGDEDATWTILTEVPAFNGVKEALEKAGLKITSAELSMVPDTSVAVAGGQAKQVMELVEALEDLDDVQKVYTNADVDEAALAG
jgi:YebC/PmpR family DNA-binding regulatory protein